MVPTVFLRSELLIRHFTPPEPDRALSLSHHKATPPHPPEPPDPPDPPDLRPLVLLSFSVSKIFTLPPPPTSALALLSVMLATVTGFHCRDPSRFTTAARSLADFNICFGELPGISLLFHALLSISGCSSSWSWFCYPYPDLLHTEEWCIGDVSISPAVLATVHSWAICDSVWAWPIKPISFWLSPTEPESSSFHFESPSDSCVSLPCDLFRGPNAGMFSSPIVWELFNISPSSVGTERSFSPSSLFRERTFPPCSLSMKEFYLPDPNPVHSVNLVTVLFSCVAAHTGPEETTELILVMLRGEDWPSKSQSKVTILQQSGFAVKCLSTHSSFASFLLSNSFGVLSSLIVLMLCCNFQRGCFVPSSCNLEV
uniref:Uncharacterized protein n=1 Tax=Noccaea caerulescens TaxID=107243 RepID=A0A1J3DKV8_NOCCA